MTTESQKRDFATLNKMTAKSFATQKNLIKRVFKGQAVPCPVCGTVLTLLLPKEATQGTAPGIYCKRGCTDVELALEAVD
jgi:hypothetical protein